MAEPRTKTIAIDSIPYYTRLEGPANGPLVVLIHALMSNHRIWDSTVIALHKAGYRTLRYDHIGHNFTLPPTDPNRNKAGAFNFDDFCHHLHSILETLTPTVTPAALIGCSIGGVLVLRYHMLYPPPAGTTTKIISCAAPGLTSLEASKPKWRARIEQWNADNSNVNLVKQTLERWFPEPLPEDFPHQKAQDIVSSCTFEGYDICVWATMNFDYTGELDSIKDGQNVMILAGELDANIGPREVLVNVHERINGSKYLLMEGTGHIPPMHWPEKFETIVLDFLSTVSG